MDERQRQELYGKQLVGDPVTNLAATSLIRAALAGDLDSGIYIMKQHGGTGTDAATMFMMSLAAVGARAILSASGYHVQRALQLLDAWTAEYGEEAELDAR